MTRRSNAAGESRGGAAVAAIDEEDSRIKLFGRTIEPKMRAVNGGELNDEQILSADDQQDLSATAHPNQSEEEDAPTSLLDELGSSSGSCEENKPDGDATGVVKMKTAAAEPLPVADANKKSSTGGNAGGAATEEKQMPRRPDKPVPCPRCNSLETKFCYFNNYNVNQPRHFCKNCQRYWTAGGTLRNVPVGAGRRKSKHNPGGAWNHQEHLNNAVRSEGSTGSPQLNMNGNLKAQQQMKVPPGQAARMRLPPILPQEMCHFSGPETSPSGSSMITSLNSSPPSMGSMFNMHLAATAAAAAAAAASQEGSPNVSPVGKSGSSAQNISDSAEANVGTADSPQLGNSRNSSECSGCTGGFNNMFNGGHWPYSFPWTNVPAGAGTSVVQGNSENKQMQADMAAWLSGVWAAGMPAWAPFAAASLWGPAGAAGWNMPWGAAAAAAAAAAFAAATTANGVTAAASRFSKSLGKHARDKPEGGRVDGCLWAPKTLRIDDPGEAAKSSIWATLGLDKVPEPGPAAGGISGMYKAFQGKHSSEARSQVHANPAALSRSMSFHENN